MEISAVQMVFKKNGWIISEFEKSCKKRNIRVREYTIF